MIARFVSPYARSGSRSPATAIVIAASVLVTTAIVIPAAIIVPATIVIPAPIIVPTAIVIPTAIIVPAPIIVEIVPLLSIPGEGSVRKGSGIVWSRAGRGRAEPE
jgi:hypothetical protein